MWSAREEGGEVRGQGLEEMEGWGKEGETGEETWAESVVNTCAQSKSTDYLGALPQILTQTGM